MSLPFCITSDQHLIDRFSSFASSPLRMQEQRDCSYPAENQYKLSVYSWYKALKRSDINITLAVKSDTLSVKGKI